MKTQKTPTQGQSTMLFLWLFCCIASTFALDLRYKRENNGVKDVGEKLILTPYIEAGEIEKAKQLAKVKPLVGEVESYSGYLTVDKKCDSNVFFWFFPTESEDEIAPVAVWLQGGETFSSTFGLFSEIGPFDLSQENNLKLRKYSWTKIASYIFIDNPVGSGYSYTNSTDCYLKNEVDAGKNLLSAVKQIMKLFPELKKKSFYVTGESYAGKYVPALSYAIHKDTDKDFKINLEGLAIGNGLIDPVSELASTDYLHELGLLDDNQTKMLKEIEKSFKESDENSTWLEAYYYLIAVLERDNLTKPLENENATTFETYYNYLEKVQDKINNFIRYISRDDVRKAIHVGNATFFNSTQIQENIEKDISQSVKPWLEELLEHYNVLIYNGEQDLLVNYPMTVGYLKKLQWSAANEYKTAQQQVWKVNDTVAGYVKTAGKLTELLVKNAGHLIPSDQPESAYELIYRFFYNVLYTAEK